MALLVSIVVTFFLYVRIKRQFARATQPVKVVVTSKALEPGKPLALEDLTLVDWPVNLPLAGAINKPESVVGRIVLYPVAAQEPIREELLAAPGASVGLSAKIPDGMRAVAIQTNEVNNVSGFLFPGCHVDALVTFRPDPGKEDSITATVLQNVEVLSTGEKLEPDPSGKPQNVKQVTVLLGPDDAQKLVLAANQGTVQFVLRNGSDQDQTQRAPVALEELKGTKVAVVSAAPRRAAAPKAEGGYMVETFDGTKRGTVKF